MGYQKRWDFKQLTDEWNWRIENIFKMQCGGASTDDLAPLRAEIDALFECAGWTEEEFDAHLTKRLFRSFAARDRAEARQGA